MEYLASLFFLFFIICRFLFFWRRLVRLCLHLHHWLYKQPSSIILLMGKIVFLNIIAHQCYTDRQSIRPFPLAWRNRQISIKDLGVFVRSPAAMVTHQHPAIVSRNTNGEAEGTASTFQTLSMQHPYWTRHLQTYIAGIWILSDPGSCRNPAVFYSWADCDRYISHDAGISTRSGQIYWSLSG